MTIVVHTTIEATWLIFKVHGKAWVYSRVCAGNAEHHRLPKHANTHFSIRYLAQAGSIKSSKMHLVSTRTCLTMVSDFFSSLVFVHGLNSLGRNRHPYHTWTHANGIFWPTDFLAEDLPSARIFVYGYNASVANAEQMSTARIKDHADTLLNLLDLERGPQQVPRISLAYMSY